MLDFCLEGLVIPNDVRCLIAGWKVTCDGNLKTALFGFEVDGPDDFALMLEKGPIVDHRLDFCKDVLQLVEC